MNRNFLLLFLFLLQGCVAPIWEQYETPNYGPSRADQICHPYGFCSPGKWVATGLAQENLSSSSRGCRDEILQASNGWSQSTVSVGLEMGRCLRSRGYKLVSQ